MTQTTAVKPKAISSREEQEFEDHIIALGERVLHRECAKDIAREIELTNEQLLDLDMHQKCDLLTFVWEAVSAFRDPFILAMFHNGIEHVLEYADTAELPPGDTP